MEELITSEVDGIQRKLIYNNNIILIDKNDSLSFDIRSITPIDIEFKVKFIFSDEGEKYKASHKIDSEGKTLIITLHNWYSSGGRFIFTTKPWIIPTKSGNLKLYLHFRTIAEKEGQFSRSFHLSIWAEEVKNGN